MTGITFYDMATEETVFTVDGMCPIPEIGTPMNVTTINEKERAETTWIVATGPQWRAHVHTGHAARLHIFVGIERGE